MGQQFKVGDRVRIVSLGCYVSHAPQGLVVGNTGRVAAVARYTVVVRTDNAEEPGNPRTGGDGWYFEPESLVRISLLAHLFAKFRRPRALSGGAR